MVHTTMLNTTIIFNNSVQTSRKTKDITTYGMGMFWTLTKTSAIMILFSAGNTG